MEKLTKVERDIIRGLIESLKDSTNSVFISGDLSQWSRFAIKMKTTINAIIPTLEAFCKEDEN